MRTILLIAGILFISSLMEFFPYLNLLVNLNTGLPMIRGINTVTTYIPIAIIVIHAIIDKKIELPHLLLFLVTVIFFLVIEFNHSLKLSGAYELEFIVKVAIVYAYYIVLLCLLKSFGLEFILKWGIVFGLAYSLVVLTSYTNLYTGHHQNFDLFGSETFQRAGREGSSINVNILSYKAVITFLMMLCYNERIGNPLKYRWLFISVSALFLVEIVIHASRGAFLTYMLILGVLLVKKGNFNTWFLGGIGLTALLILYSEQIIESFSTLQIYERLGEDVDKVSRIVQLRANLQNFVKSPFTGVGYVNAARGYSDDIVRSNVTWTQILASHGIFYTLFYIYFLFRLFIFNSGMLKYTLPLAICLFLLINLSSQRPFAYLSLLAVIGYSEFHLVNAPNEEAADIVS